MDRNGACPPKYGNVGLKTNDVRSAQVDQYIR